MAASLLVAFRVTYMLATALFVAAGGLITASHFLSEHGPIAPRFLAISIAVSGVCLAIGFLIRGIEYRIFKIAKPILRGGVEVPDAIDRHLAVLLAYLIVGGMALCVVMVAAIYAMLMRIDQGFAVFG